MTGPLSVIAGVVCGSCVEMAGMVGVDVAVKVLEKVGVDAFTRGVVGVGGYIFCIHEGLQVAQSMMELTDAYLSIPGIIKNAHEYRHSKHNVDIAWDAYLAYEEGLNNV